MEQRCPLVNVWLTWVGMPLLAAVVGWRIGWIAGVAVLLAGILFQVFYLRTFPSWSRMLGYGSVEDVAADAGGAKGDTARPTDVILYTANVCPFCPIVRKRLAGLQAQMPLNVREVDVTFRPDIIRAKGLKSVPVIEVNGKLLLGNATSQQIASFIQSSVRASV